MAVRTASGGRRPVRRGRHGRRRARDPHWDNVRFVSGTLVLLSHLTEPLLASADGLRWLYVATWALRVPAFVLLAGYFSSAGPLGFREARQLTEAVLVPYVLLGLLHTLQLRYYYGEWEFFTAEPAWGLWFLLSLFCWRLLLPALAVLRYPLTVSLAAALTVGYVDAVGSTLSASRTVAFLPFFLLGWRLRQGRAPRPGPGGGPGAVPWTEARWTRNLAVAVLAGTAVAAWPLRRVLREPLLALRDPYAEAVPLAAPWAWAPRGAVLLCGMVIVLSFVRLVPRRRLPVVSYLGSGGLYLYLLHPLAVRVLHVSGDVRWAGPWPEQLLLVLVGVLLAAALASPPVRWAARPLVQPRLPWLFAAPPPGPSRPPPGPPHAADGPGSGDDPTGGDRAAVGEGPTGGDGTTVGDGAPNRAPDLRCPAPR
ncbi:hypothetical protein E0L36_00280 [Streptomyces sp. AJS327]|uniref:acyltransferase family protein n=1 Tax=Streptomyces sp. AJS327 TaxID=2545265 RepID=UPI0015DE059B|nr:acyltransferase family protein [Streptomyces sp. AJS327]MBA0049405.1 hypothetical protein [Streptomyces sp. AJS327]